MQQASTKKETNSGQKQNNTHDDIWIGDTGATCHMTNWTIGLWDVQPYEGIVVVATGAKTMVTHVGTIKGKVLYKAETPIILKIGSSRFG